MEGQHYAPYQQQHLFMISEPTPANQRKNTQVKATSKSQRQSSHGNSKEQVENEYQSLIGIQAQNLYLLNYINKLEFLIQQGTKEKKRECKQREKQLTKILKAVSKKPNIVNDIESLDYYLGITQGIDNGEVREKDSDEEEKLDSDTDNFTKKLFGPAQEIPFRQDPLVQLLQPPSGQTTNKSNEAESSEFFRSEKDVKQEFLKKEPQILEKYEQNKEKTDYIMKIEEMRNKLQEQKSKSKKGNIDVKKFLQQEWQNMAKEVSELVGSFQE